MDVQSPTAKREVSSVKTLYEAEVNVVFYLLAETDDDARLDAIGYAREEVDNLLSTDVMVVREPTAIYVEWKKSYPYGGECDDFRTVEDFFNHIEERKKREAADREYLKKQGHLFPREEVKM